MDCIQELTGFYTTFFTPQSLATSGITLLHVSGFHKYRDIEMTFLLLK